MVNDCWSDQCSTFLKRHHHFYSNLVADLVTFRERQPNDEIDHFKEGKHAGSKKQTHEPTNFSWNIVQSNITFI